MANDIQSDEDRRGVYPYTSLEPSLEVSYAVRSLGGGKAEVSKSLLAQTLNEDEKGQTLTFRIASAKAFGLIQGRSKFTLTELAKNFYFPTDDKSRDRALRLFLIQPKAFDALIKRFDGSKLPEREILGNILQRETGVPESWKQRVATFFEQSAKFVKVIDGNGFLRFRASLEGPIDNASELGKNETVVATEQANQTISLPGVGLSAQVSAFPKVESGGSVWAFSHQNGLLRVETPANISMELWKKLNAYVELLKPSEGTETK